MNDSTYTITYPRRRVCEMPTSEQPLTRLHRYGYGALADRELLALILGTPDALDLAIELLQLFGSLAQLAQASCAQLQRVHGIGTAQAARLVAFFELGRRIQAPTFVNRPRITCPADGAAFLQPRMAHLRQEEIHLLLLNTRNCVIDAVQIYRGSLNSCVVRLSELFRPAIEASAAAIILAHNHPSGDPTPSREDIKITEQAVEVGKMLSIDVLDHLIIGHHRFVSLKERGVGFS